MPVADYESFEFEDGGISHTVYKRGSGPALLLLHELPGLSDFTFEVADGFAKEGFTIYLPLLFGKAGDFKVAGNVPRLCVNRELRVFEHRRPGPIADWLRALARKAKEEQGGPGVGVLGMCLTGNFAISMFADDTVIAPVSCQPSLPLAIGRKRRHSIALSDEQIEKIRKRTDAGEKILAYRFEEDFLCPGARFARLRAEFGEGFVGHEIKRQHWWQMRHSLLTLNYVDEAGHPTYEARQEIIAFLKERLFAETSADAQIRA